LSGQVIQAVDICVVFFFLISMKFSMLELNSYLQVEADKAIEELQLKSAELASVVEQLKQEPDEFDIDDSVQGTNVVFNQLSV